MINKVIKKTLIFIINFIYISAGGGFKGDTLVATPFGYIPICQLSEGHPVLSYNFEFGAIQTRRITRIESHFENGYRKLNFLSNELKLSLDQKVLLKRHGWMESSKLIRGLRLIGLNDGISILQSKYVDNKIKLYEISVEENENFFVTENNILAHNMVVMLPVALEAPVILETVASIGITLGAYFLKSWLNNDSSTQKQEKAPGKPTEKDGYKPPKNWDGKKKPHPKTGQYGYPDKNGKIWVPSGEKGHGGPHWDVVDESGNEHDNILPGGKTRGQK